VQAWVFRTAPEALATDDQRQRSEPSADLSPRCGFEAQGAVPAGRRVARATRRLQ
jgi:hypothetical protein